MINSQHLKSASEVLSPLSNVALTFSGGGFRASGFSLGVLSYLNHIDYEGAPLLERVKFITSTSGGSITNGTYVCSLYSGQHDFQTFFRLLYNSMEGEKLLARAFAILNDDSRWDFKPRNLINSFALAYDEMLTNQSTLGLIAGSVLTQKPHLEKTCFNTTEFNNGMNFYFQADGHKGHISIYGNSYLKFQDFKTAQLLKISDLIAASSCFPMGFEPLIYPTDFLYKGCEDPEPLTKAIQYGHHDAGRVEEIQDKPFALMDGGICDNMGIRAVEIEDDIRAREGRAFDLILSCDVTSYFNEPLPPVKGAKKKFWSRFKLSSTLNIVKWGSVAGTAFSGFSIFFPFVAPVGYLLLLPSLGGLAAGFGIPRLLRKASKDKDTTLGLALPYLKYFSRLPLKDLVPLLQARLDSGMKLVSEVFLQQIRRGQYDHFFSSPEMKGRAISVLIYEFSSAHEPRRLKHLESRDRAWWPALQSTLMPSSALQKAANEAKSMGTTLWYTKNDQPKRDAVIAAGQFTVCYNLIKHIHRLEVQDARQKDNEVLQKLKGKLLEDWARFQGNPYWLVEGLILAQI